MPKTKKKKLLEEIRRRKKREETYYEMNTSAIALKGNLSRIDELKSLHKWALKNL